MDLRDNRTNLTIEKILKKDSRIVSAASDRRSKVAKDLKNMKPINVQVADLSDDDLEIILKLRKMIKEPEEREAYVKGLLHIAMIDNDYSEEEKSLVEGTACALGINEDKYNAIKAQLASDNKTDSFTSVIV